MKLQLSLVIVIAAILVYIYCTRHGQERQLLGRSLKDIIKEAKERDKKRKRALADAKNKWKQVYGSKRMPNDESLMKWSKVYYKYRELNGNKNPSSKLNLFQWETDLAYWYKVYGTKRRFEPGFDLVRWAANYRKREAEIRKAKQARIEAEKKAKDPCEWIKLRKK